MAVANSSYEFEITSTEARDGAHPKSGLLTAVVQGTCTDKDGNVTKVDKSWGYKKDAEGTLRIVLHHSSLPYQP